MEVTLYQFLDKITENWQLHFLNLVIKVEEVSHHVRSLITSLKKKKRKKEKIIEESL